MQLNSVVTFVLAVVVLREPCTMLQVAGAVLMVAGSLVTQRGSRKSSSRPLEPTMFAPRMAVGFFFASMAALAYGTSPIVIRQALLDGGPLSGVAGGVYVYAAATAAVVVGLLIRPLRSNVMSVSAENARWFVPPAFSLPRRRGFSTAPWLLP